jgi:hypothetical protein
MASSTSTSSSSDRSFPFSLPEIDVDKLTGFVTDAFYVAVGASVLAFQKAQVLRREVTERFEGQFGFDTKRFEDLRASFTEQLKTLDERYSSLEAKLESLLDQVQEKLPEPADKVLSQAREAAKSAREQVREFVLRDAA